MRKIILLAAVLFVAAIRGFALDAAILAREHQGHFEDAIVALREQPGDGMYIYMSAQGNVFPVVMALDLGIFNVAASVTEQIGLYDYDAGHAVDFSAFLATVAAGVNLEWRGIGVSAGFMAPFSHVSVEHQYDPAYPAAVEAIESARSSWYFLPYFNGSLVELGLLLGLPPDAFRRLNRAIVESAPGRLVRMFGRLGRIPSQEDLALQDPAWGAALKPSVDFSVRADGTPDSRLELSAGIGFPLGYFQGSLVLTGISQGSAEDIAGLADFARDPSSWRFRLAFSRYSESGLLRAGATYRQDVGAGGFLELGLDMGGGWSTRVSVGYRDAYTMLMPAWMFDDSASFSLGATMTVPL